MIERKCRLRCRSESVSAVLFVILSSVLFAGCFSTNNNRPASANMATNLGAIECPVVPPQGLLFSQFSAPLDINCEYQDAEIPPLSQLKRGESQDSMMIHPWLFVWPSSIAVGYSSIAEAAREGQISTVYYADYEYMQVLGVYASFKVVVYGQ